MCRKSLVLKGFANSTATFCCYRQRDGRDGEVPLFERPQGVSEPLLQAHGAARVAGRWAPGADLAIAEDSGSQAAERAYAATHAEIELLFAQWRKEEKAPTATSSPSAEAAACTSTPLTPGLLRRLADAHYLDVYENDFRWRGDLWKQVHEAEEAFWRGDIVALPSDDWVEFKGKQHSYFARLMEEPVLEEVFLYAVFRDRSELQALRKPTSLATAATTLTERMGCCAQKQMSLSDADRLRLIRKLMEVEIKVLEDLSAGNEASFDRIVERRAVDPHIRDDQAKPGELISKLIEKYLEDTSRAREWPMKTVLRKRSELREFVEIAGDKPVNAYRQADGVEFKDVQLALPVNRQKPPFRGPAVEERTEGDGAAQGRRPRRSSQADNHQGQTRNGSLFFAWAKARDSSVVNPVAEQRVQLRRNKRGGKKRHPWTIDELNRMFAAPIFTGCRSARNWKQPGNVVLRESAKYWVPLIALYSGMRLGEIIQMQVADVKTMEGIEYFDVTPVAFEDEDEEGYDASEEKSFKTESSRRAVPIHKTLLDLGFGEILASQRANGARRLFPEFARARDDGSWSKRFSKYFKRFREIDWGHPSRREVSQPATQRRRRAPERRLRMMLRAKA